MPTSSVMYNMRPFENMDLVVSGQQLVVVVGEGVDSYSSRPSPHNDDDDLLLSILCVQQLFDQLINSGDTQ